MFGYKNLTEREKILEDRINALLKQKNCLIDQVDELKIQNKSLHQKRVMEEEQIAHKLKMREETCDINYQKKEQVKNEECAQKVREVKDQYRDKLEVQLVKRGDELKTMYTEILARLPNINATLKKKI